MKINKPLKITLIVLSSIVLFFMIINIVPPKKVLASNPFISTSGKPMICAHRGGASLNPENTLKAFKDVVKNYNVEILETDIWITKDNILVLNHDAHINRMSDVELITGSTEKYNISDHTLEELRQFNYGYNFKINDEYPYRDITSIDDPNRAEVIKSNDLSITPIRELFSEFYESHPNMLFSVEIKNGGDLGIKAADILYDMLVNEFNAYKNRIIIASFHNEVEQHVKKNYPDIIRGASTKGATTFIATQLFKVNIFDNQSFAALQIPLKKMGINLAQKNFVKRAHRRNIAVQYWTINEEEDMIKLIKIGCDAIMTDNPKLLNEVIQKYEQNK